MFNRIKEWFTFQRFIQLEVLETLQTICLWMYEDGRCNHRLNRYSEFLESHARVLNSMSSRLKAQIKKAEEKER